MHSDSCTLLLFMNVKRLQGVEISVIISPSGTQRAILIDFNKGQHGPRRINSVGIITNHNTQICYMIG